MLQSLESNTLREDCCIQYRVTKHIKSPFAEDKSMPIVFHVIWQDMAAFEQHCQQDKIVNFFQTYCLADDWNVTVYSDED